MRKSSLAVAASLLIVVSSANAGSVPTNLVGMTATSYTMSGSSYSRPQLSFQSSLNGSFNPSYVDGVNTGDWVEQTGSDSWTLGAYAADYGAILSYPGSLNTVGVEANATGGAFGSPSALSCTFTLVFSGNQIFIGLQYVNSFNSITATLTHSGGTTTDLTTAATDGSTVFTAGTYTLDLQGNGYTETSTATLVALFTSPASAVPGTGIAALLGAMLVARRRRR
jgi:hypothetical protein